MRTRLDIALATGVVCLLGRVLPPLWLPLVLVTAACLPTCLARRSLRELGWRRDHAGGAVLLAAGTLTGALALTGLALWLWRNTGRPWPLGAAGPRDPGPLWFVAQFTHVALPEELFFRGYVQGRLARSGDRSATVGAVVATAGLFAICHVIIGGSWLRAATFLPGLILGTLFARTGSLWAPVLFHGGANVGYLVLTRLLLG